MPDYCWEIRNDGIDYYYYGCDDGNVVSNDGCSWMGIIESGWWCNNGRPPLLGNPGQRDRCWSLCGDGLRVGPGGMSNTLNVLAAFPEACDDNDTLPNPVAVLNNALIGPSTAR